MQHAIVVFFFNAPGSKGFGFTEVNLPREGFSSNPPVAPVLYVPAPFADDCLLYDAARFFLSRRGRRFSPSQHGPHYLPSYPAPVTRTMQSRCVIRLGTENHSAFCSSFKCNFRFFSSPIPDPSLSLRVGSVVRFCATQQRLLDCQLLSLHEGNALLPRKPQPPSSSPRHAGRLV